MECGEGQLVFLLYGLLSKRERSIKFCAVIGCPRGTIRLVPQEQFPQNQYNKSFIDQACSVEIIGYCPSSFLRVYGPQLLLCPQRRKKKEVGQKPNHVDFALGQ